MEGHKRIYNFCEKNNTGVYPSLLCQLKLLGNEAQIYGSFFIICGWFFPCAPYFSLIYIVPYRIYLPFVYRFPRDLFFFFIHNMLPYLFCPLSQTPLHSLKLLFLFLVISISISPPPSLLFFQLCSFFSFFYSHPSTALCCTRMSSHLVFFSNKIRSLYICGSLIGA